MSSQPALAGLTIKAKSLQEIEVFCGKLPSSKVAWELEGNPSDFFKCKNGRVYKTAKERDEELIVLEKVRSSDFSKSTNMPRITECPAGTKFQSQSSTCLIVDNYIYNGK